MTLLINDVTSVEGHLQQIETGTNSTKRFSVNLFLYGMVVIKMSNIQPQNKPCAP